MSLSPLYQGQFLEALRIGYFPIKYKGLAQVLEASLYPLYIIFKNL
jgi:hypothetical protein